MFRGGELYPATWGVSSSSGIFQHFFQGWLVVMIHRFLSGMMTPSIPVPGREFHQMVVKRIREISQKKWPHEFRFWNYSWVVLSDEQISKRWPFSLLNDEQMSNKVRVEHQPVIVKLFFLAHLSLVIVVWIIFRGWTNWILKSKKLTFKLFKTLEYGTPLKKKKKPWCNTH